jgi:tetratricopeptide (TPR) repeat protein
MKKPYLAVIIFMWAGALNAAINSSGLIMYPVLDIGVGARGISMAGAFTALADDSTAIYWNPAGLAKAGEQEINMTHALWILDSYIDFITINMPMETGVAGINIIYANMGFLEKRDDSGYINGPDINSHSIGGAIGYGLELFNGLDAGASFRFINQYIGDQNIYALSADAGMVYKMADFLNLGLDLQNIPVKSQYALPLNIKAGATTGFYSGEHSVSACIDVKYQINRGISAAAGAEYSFNKIAFVRAGYEYDPGQQGIAGDINGLNAGAGLCMGRFKLDYSVKFNGSLGLNHLISLTMKYGQPAVPTAQKTEKPAEVTRDFREDTDTVVSRMMSDGINYYDSGDYDEALNSFTGIKNIMPSFKDIDKWLSDTSAMIDRLKKTEEKKKMKDRLDTQLGLGMQLYKDKNFQQALDIFKNAKKIEPDNKTIDNWIDSARAQLAKAQGGKLAPYMKEAMSLYDACDYEGAIKKYSEIIKQFGEAGEAVKYLEKARQKLDDLENFNQNAKKEIEKGLIFKAVRILRKALAACSTNYDAREQLAKYKPSIDRRCRELYYDGIDKYTNGDLEAAMKAWEEVWVLDPSGDFSKKAKTYTQRAKDKRKAIIEFSR